MKKDVYQVITDRIIALIEKGTVPWRKPWKGSNQAPQNFVSRNAYRGINLFLLNAAGFASPFWLTFRQVQSLNARVKKGEKSFPVVFWKVLEEEEEGETKRIPFLRCHSVFNLAQCEGITAPASPEMNREFHPIEKCEKVPAHMPSPPTIEHGGARACYSPHLDTVSMPDAQMFESLEAYYGTLFHELTHATGHVTRLNRKEITEPIHFGSDPYSREELVAEMGAAFLCGHSGIENTTLEQSASYIQNWLRRLQDDRKLVVQAAAKAQQASDFILNVSVEGEETIREKPKEFKVVALRECPTPESMQVCDMPEQAAGYWKMHVATSPQFNPECECLVVIILNSRRRVKGHHVVSIGTMDTILVHPREVFRTAIIASASAILLMHNHPSGEPIQSDADIRVTRDLIRAGKLLKIDVFDHVIVGHERHSSLRDLGYFDK